MQLHAPLISAPIVAAAALLVAGCGGSSKSNSTSSGSGGGQGNGAETAFKYSQCMRQHGVANFPDPAISSSGSSVKIAIHVDPSITGSPKFSSAQHACSSILPQGGTGRENSPQREAGLLAFAKCMRAHQVPSFPDPTSSGQLTIEMLHAANVDVKAPAVQAAAEACIPASDGVINQAAVQQAEAQG